MTRRCRAATLRLRRQADAAERMEAEDMAESKMPGPRGDAQGVGGWGTVLPSVVLLLRAGVTDGQLSHLTDLRVRVQRGAFASDGGPAGGPAGEDLPGRRSAKPEGPDVGTT